MDKFKDIVNMSEDELIEKHDEMGSYSPSGDFYLKEYYRRQQDKSNQKMLGYTKWMTIMTGVVTCATIINLIIFIIQSSTQK